MYWSAANEEYLYWHRDIRFLTIEQRIHDKYYYNCGPFFSTNLPYSSNAKCEDPWEEVFQSYSEVDMEIRDPGLIRANYAYYFRFQWDAEKKSIDGAPVFKSSVQWERQAGGDIKNDTTGSFTKLHKQR